MLVGGTSPMIRAAGEQTRCLTTELPHPELPACSSLPCMFASRVFCLYSTNCSALLGSISKTQSKKLCGSSAMVRARDTDTLLRGEASRW